MRHKAQRDRDSLRRQRKAERALKNFRRRELQQQVIQEEILLLAIQWSL